MPPLKADTVHAAASVGAEPASRTDSPVATGGMAMVATPSSVMTITAVAALAESGISMTRTTPAPTAHAMNVATGRRSAKRPTTFVPIIEPTPKQTKTSGTSPRGMPDRSVSSGERKLNVPMHPPMTTTVAPSTSQRRPLRSARSSEPTEGAVPRSSSGANRPMTTAATAARAATAQNVPRQPRCSPASEPSGTPRTVESATPLPMTPSARELAAGPAARVATTDATDQNAPVTTAVSTRAARRSANEPLRAAMTCPAAKIASASTRVSRFGRRNVAIAITGAPTIMPMANAVMSSPICDGLMPKSSAICASRPAIMNSVVHIRNVPSASTGTTGGNLLFSCRATAAMRPWWPGSP